MSTNRTENALLQDGIFGPIGFIDSSHVNTYKKNSPSRNSISSEMSFKEISQQNSNAQSQEKLSVVVQVLKAKQEFQNKGQKSNSNFFRGSKRQLLEPRNMSIQNQEKQSFLKACLTNRLINKFKRNLFQSSYVLPQNLKEILDGEAYLQEQKEKQKTSFMLKISKAQKKAKNQEKLTQILMPGKNLTIIWDLISLLIQFLSLFLCSMIASFGQNHDFFKVSIIFILTYIFIEGLLSNYRPIINQGEIVTDYSLIFNIYIKNQFIEDFISFVIWILIFFNFNQYVILNEIMAIILFIITVRKIARKYNIQIEYLYLKGFNSNVLDIVTLIILICFYAHTMGCLWHYIGKQTEQYGSWLTHYQINNESTWVQYNYSFYWATTTMVTVGYGDITPQNQTEITFVIIMMLISSFMFAYTMNSIGLIVKSFYDQQTRYKRTLILINQFMSKNQVDTQIQSRVRNYIKFSIENEILENKEDTIKIINDLPIGLRQELELDIQTKVVQKIQLFTSNFSIQSQNLVKAHLTEIKYTPKDIIYHKNDTKDKNLYFISEGEVQIYDEQSKKVLKTMKAGEIFGEYQFFTGQDTKESTMSVNFTQLYKIDREKFIGIVKQQQKDFERFHKIRELILFSNNYQVIQQKCSTCKQTNHSQIDCPYLTYQPNLYIKVLKQNKLELNLRKEFKRDKKKFNSLIILKQIQETTQEYRDNLSESSNSDTQDQEISQQISADIINEENRQKSNISLTKHVQQQTAIQKRESKVISEIDKKKQQSQVFSKKKQSLVEEEKRRTIYRDTLLFKQLDQFQEYFYSRELEGFDKIQNYTEYFPQNNLVTQIKNLNRDKLKSKMKSLQAQVQVNFRSSFRKMKS